MLRREDLKGLWRRTFLQREGHEPDRETRVFWLQGARFFVDLRQPGDRPEFGDVTCLRDLRADHLHWLSAQEGFAGEFSVKEGIAEWDRAIDFQTPFDVADRGYVKLDGNVLEEVGVEAAYIEHWARQIMPEAPGWGAVLTDQASGAVGYLVQAGEMVMYARSRSVALPQAQDLRAAIHGAASLAAKQDMVDFEISIGRRRAGENHFRIVHSTMPFKESRCWRLQTEPPGTDSIVMADIDSDGRSYTRHWRITEIDDRKAFETAFTMDFKPAG